MQKLFGRLQVLLYLLLILIIIALIVIVQKNKKDMGLITKKIDSISEEVKKMNEGSHENSKIIKEVLKTNYINSASEKKGGSWENMQNYSNIENNEDSEQMAKKVAEETRLKLHSAFGNENKDYSWAQDHEQLFWNNYQEWSHLALQSASPQHHFSLDSVQCKSSMCYLNVHYDKNYSTFDQEREVMALLRSVDSCGFTSVGYDEENGTHEWFLECNKTNSL